MALAITQIVKAPSPTSDKKNRAPKATAAAVAAIVVMVFIFPFTVFSSAPSPRRGAGESGGNALSPGEQAAGR